MQDSVIAMFELTIEDDQVRVVEERHYKLVEANKIDQVAIREYRE